MNRLLLVGCGEMGGALLNGWLKAGLNYSFHVVTRDPARVPVHKSVTVFERPEDLGSSFYDFILIAVKPLVVPDILPLYKNHLHEKGVVLTIAAGVPTSIYADAFPGHPIVRLMPNLPAIVHKGITFMYSNQELTPKQSQEIQSLVQSVGDMYTCSKEDQLNMATAIAGCGPGFLFEIMRTYTDLVEELGYRKEEAQNIARTLLIGSGLFVQKELFPFDVLVDKMGGEGSMTLAGIGAMRKENILKKMLDASFKAAIKRGRDIQKSLGEQHDKTPTRGNTRS